MSLKAVVLGSAAGGGFPQWNCRCAVCRLAWEGDPSVKARSQASVAVSGDGQFWTLLNASPDMRAQILATPQLHPRGVRESPIAAVVLTGAEIDQTAGLLALRERHSFAIYGTAETLAAVQSNPMTGALNSNDVSWQVCPLGRPFSLPGNVTATLFAVPGKVPLYQEELTHGVVETAIDTELNVGVELSCEDRRLAFVPGAAALDAALIARLARMDAVMFDATLFTDDEMIRSGTGAKTGRRMGHMPISGDGGSLALLRDLPGRRIYTHINNTNPILIEGSPERRMVEEAGIEVAYDGMEVVL